MKKKRGKKRGKTKRPWPQALRHRSFSSRSADSQLSTELAVLVSASVTTADRVAGGNGASPEGSVLEETKHKRCEKQ